MSKEEGLGSRLKSLFTRPKRQSQAALNTAEDRKPYAVSAEHLQVRFQTGQPQMGQCSGTSEWNSHRLSFKISTKISNDSDNLYNTDGRLESH